MTYCYEGTTIDLLDKLFERAEKENQLDQIWNAKDYRGNTAYHIAAKHGNPKALTWVL